MKRKLKAKKRDIVLGRQRLNRLRKLYLIKIPLKDGELSFEKKCKEDNTLKEVFSVGRDGVGSEPEL